MIKHNTEELLAFIEKSPTCFHVVDTMRSELEAAGFTQLQENGQWQLKARG